MPFFLLSICIDESMRWILKKH